MSYAKSTKNVIGVAVVAILLLLGTAGYLLLQNSSLKNEIARYDAEFKTFTQAQAKLENDYNIAVANLDKLKGDNAQLNELIEKQKEELRVQKNKISTLIWKSKKLKEANIEIENLKAQATAYVQEINDLREQNAVLAGANEKLQSDNKVLSERLDITTTEKDSIVVEKTKLEKENKKLFAKANKASALKIEDVQVKGYKIKENGEHKENKKAKSVQLFKICFDIIPNEIAEKSYEDFFVRIIDPSGVTIYDEYSGSGIITKAEDNTKLKYTKRYDIENSGYEENICLVWPKTTDLQKGTYFVELYNKGYLSGSARLKLK